MGFPTTVLVSVLITDTVALPTLATYARVPAGLTGYTGGPGAHSNRVSNHRVGGGVDHRHSAVVEVGDVDAGTRQVDRDAFREIAHGDGVSTTVLVSVLITETVSLPALVT